MRQKKTHGNHPTPKGRIANRSASRQVEGPESEEARDFAQRRFPLVDVALQGSRSGDTHLNNGASGESSSYRCGSLSIVPGRRFALGASNFLPAHPTQYPTQTSELLVRREWRGQLLKTVATSDCSRYEKNRLQLLFLSPVLAARAWTCCGTEQRCWRETR
jgi:hypothetical protein